MALRIQHRQLISGVNASRVLGLVILVTGLSAQVAERQPRFSVPQDWTHSHVAFTRTVFSEHPELLDREPRVMHQFLRRLRPFLRSGIASTPSQASGAGDQQMKRDWNVSLGAGIVARGMSPAVFVVDVTDTTANCAGDYTVFALDVAGTTGGQASLIAFNNLYSGTGGLCGTGAPSVLFSYNTTTAGGTIITSPVLSLDGARVAFVESAATSSVFHVLTWAPGPGNGASATNSAAPGVGNIAAMTSLTYAPATNTRSSPWVDYTNDVVYVGADDGKLYKITGVFKGTPALAGLPWPVTINAASKLTGPVLDQVTGNLFLGDNKGLLTAVSANSPTTRKTLQIGHGARPGIFDPPLVDSVNGTVFAVSTSDGTSAVVVQADASTLTGLAQGRIGLGSAGGTNLNIYDGAFDNNYQINNPAAGFLFVCGTGAADTSPWSYSFGFNGSIMNSTPSSQVQILSSTRARCSPVTEFFNPSIGAGGTDFFFLGLTTDCQGRPSSGCVWSRTSSDVITTANETSGTSAIVVDNSSTAGQASSIYFSNQAAAGSAVKVTQNGLQ